MARDWSGFALAIYLVAPLDDAWTALSTPAGIESWFPAKVDFRDAAGALLLPDTSAAPGMTYRWEWFEGSSEGGRVIEVEDERRVRWSWYEDKGWAEFRLSEVSGRRLVEVEQRVSLEDEEAAQQCYIDCKTGWTFYLANLRAVLDGGVDLRETKPDRKDLVNY